MGAMSVRTAFQVKIVTNVPTLGRVIGAKYVHRTGAAHNATNVPTAGKATSVMIARVIVSPASIATNASTAGAGQTAMFAIRAGRVKPVTNVPATGVDPSAINAQQTSASTA